jgi:hypothetical protein
VIDLQAYECEIKYYRKTLLLIWLYLFFTVHRKKEFVESNSNAPDLYFGNDLFESRQGHSLSWLFSFEIFMKVTSGLFQALMLLACIGRWELQFTGGTSAVLSGFSWFVSVPPGNYRTATSTRTSLFPSISFPVHCSLKLTYYSSL